MSELTLSTEALATLACRAALRAQPTFRVNENGARAGVDDARELLAALYVCAWSGSCVFIRPHETKTVLSAIRDVRSVVSQRQLSERPEFVAAMATEMYLVNSPDLQADLNTLAASSRMHTPTDFAESAMRAIDADFALFMQEPEPRLFAKRPLWPEGTPHNWRDLIAGYATSLGEHGLEDMAKRYLGVIDSAGRGDLDWTLPYDFVRRWSEERESSQRATKQVPPSENVRPEPQSIDLTSYSLSHGAQNILAGAVENLAARHRAALGANAIVLEMADQGRPTTDPQWIGDFVRQAVFVFPQQYATVMKNAGFRPGRRRPALDDPALRERMKQVATMPGLVWCLDQARVLARDTSGSDTIAGRHLFAALILDPPPPFELGSIRVLSEIGLSIPLLRQRLFQWVRGYGDDDAAWRRALIGTAIIPRRRAGFDADSTKGPDLLDIEQDVLALATLIAARESSPPLSIGLFGDWGSGKTFFMDKLRQAVADLSAEARDANVMQRDHWFYKRIVQIEFNAWHYVEGNLWASMVEHILSNLRFSDEPDLTVTQQLQEHLIGKLGFAKQAAEESTEKEAAAASKVTEAQEAVRAAKQEHDTKKDELQALSRESVKRDFDLGGVTQAIIEALKPLGIVPAGTSVAEMEASLRLARSVVERGHAGLTSLVRADDRADRWRSLLIILIGAPVATGLLTYLISLMTQAQIARVSTIVTGAAGFLVAAARWIRQQAEWLAEQQEKVEEGQKLYDAAISAGLAEQAAQIANKEQELALARQDYLLAQQRAEQARLQKEAASAELAAATTPRLLGRFVQDRAASTDYRKHLGVLAVVRQDFQQLSRLIEEDNWRLAPENPAVDKRYEGRLKKVLTLKEENDEASTRINRIVLYIDDLDRCPPAKVVEVLQAVHLLLAFPLFVVVVGVDARWISRSLESRYRELLHVGDKEGALDITEVFGVARSEDYLEKIFQVPLWLRRMDGNAARRMVQGMLRKTPPPKRDEEQSNSHVPPPEPAQAQSKGTDTSIDPGAKTQIAQASGSPSADTNAHAPQQESTAAMSGGNVGTPARPATAATVNPESLTVHDFEIQAIDMLPPLLGRSPRALKRFVNVYRLIKAGLTPAEHAAFIDQSKQRLDDFAAVLLLLAIDTGLPRASTAVFEVLLDVGANDDAVDVDEFLKRLDANPAAANSDAATLKIWIERYRQTRWFLNDAEAIRTLATWTPRVMRHSFQAAHTAATNRRVDPDDASVAESEPAPKKRTRTPAKR